MDENQKAWEYKDDFSVFMYIFVQRFEGPPLMFSINQKEPGVNEGREAKFVFDGVEDIGGKAENAGYHHVSKSFYRRPFKL